MKDSESYKHGVMMKITMLIGYVIDSNTNDDDRDTDQSNEEDDGNDEDDKNKNPQS